MAKNLLFLIFLYSTTIWAQKTDDTFEQLYMKTISETAAKDMSRALKIADSMTKAATTPEHKGRGLMLSASLYFQQMKYEKSLPFAEKAKDIFNTTENYELQAKIHGLLATEYRSMALNHKSKKYADEGLKIADNIQDIQKKMQVKALFCQELAYYDINQKKYNSAENNLKASLNYLSKVPGDKITLGKSYQLLAEVYCMYLNNYTLAEEYYWKAIKILPESNPSTALSYDGLGKVKYFQKKYDESEKYFLKALEFAEHSDHPELKRRVYSSMAELYEKTNQYQKAVVYRKKYVEVFNKIQDKYKNTVDKDYNKIDTENQQYASWNSIKNIVIGIASLLILSLIIIFFINKKKHKAEYLKFKNIIDHYKEKEEYVLESKIITSEIEEKETEEENISEEIDTENKQTDIAINKETEAKILEQLDHFEKDEMFNNSYISLSFLATEFSTNSKYISYVVKKHKNVDFKSYINKLRINYIIHKLNTSPKYRKYKVSALAEECGFSSHSKFATIFKSITGISPSTFISFIEQEEANKK